MWAWPKTNKQGNKVHLLEWKELSRHEGMGVSHVIQRKPEAWGAMIHSATRECHFS